jgi:hypothetical protein
MSNSGMLVLTTCAFLLLVEGMSALGDFRASVNDTSATVKNSADLGTGVANPIFTVLAYVALAVISICLLQSFRSL